MAVGTVFNGMLAALWPLGVQRAPARDKPYVSSERERPVVRGERQ